MRTAKLLAGGWLLMTALNVMLLPRKFAPRVEVYRLQRIPMPLMVRAVGTLEAKDSNTVKSQFDGPVVMKKFREGQQVQKGELLAVMGRDRIRGDYQSKKDAYVNAQSDLTHAQRDLRMQKQLYKKEAVAYSTVDDAKRMVVKAEQGLRGAKEAMKAAQEQWDSSSVVAPISGTVVKDGIGEDKFVAAAKDLVTVADVSEYTVHAKVDELDIRQIHEGQRAIVNIQIFGKASLPAVVTEVGSQLEGSGLPEISVILRLTATQGLDLRPKLSSECKILTGMTEPILAVPLTAIVNTDGNPHVWVMNVLNRLKKRDVVMGRTNPDLVEIVQGLSAGDRVCIMAEPDFADGMHAVVGAPDDKNRSRTAQFLPEAKKDDASKPKRPTSRGRLPF